MFRNIVQIIDGPNAIFGITRKGTILELPMSSIPEGKSYTAAFEYAVNTLEEAAENWGV